jgi:hypothetical protein
MTTIQAHHVLSSHFYQSASRMFQNYNMHKWKRLDSSVCINFVFPARFYLIYFRNLFLLNILGPSM